jgi:N-acetylneuraminate lyase
MKSEKIEGIIAASFTPLKEDGELNLPVVEKYAYKLKQDGIQGVFVCGTTGEGYSLTLEERKLVLQEWLTHREGDFKVIAHVGSTSTLQSAELARHAAEKGASAISAMGPSFFQPTRAEELVGYCARIAQEAPDIPFYYYHIPAMSGVNVSMKEFLTQASVSIPNLQGIKFTHTNLMEMQQCMMFGDGSFDIVHGYDEVLLGGLALGAKAAIGSTYNYMAPHYLRLISQFEKGNIEAARALQRYAVKLVEVLFKYRGGVVCGKAIQSLCGIECGPCRLPLQTLSDIEIHALRKDLEAIEFFEIINNPNHLKL